MRSGRPSPDGPSGRHHPRPSLASVALPPLDAERRLMSEALSRAPRAVQSRQLARVDRASSGAVEFEGRQWERAAVFAICCFPSHSCPSSAARARFPGDAVTHCRLLEGWGHLATTRCANNPRRCSGIGPRPDRGRCEGGPPPSDRTPIVSAVWSRSPAGALWDRVPMVTWHAAGGIGTEWGGVLPSAVRLRGAEGTGQRGSGSGPERVRGTSTSTIVTLTSTTTRPACLHRWRRIRSRTWSAISGIGAPSSTER